MRRVLLRAMRLVVPGATPHCHTDIANALRRSMLSDVPTTSVASVTFNCNESIMSDKQLAHRIGSLVFKRGDTDDFVIDVQAPATSTLLVTSESLRTSGGVRPVTDSVPLVLLGPGARLTATAKMQMGTGRDHARFSPVEVVQYDASSTGHVELTVEPTGAVAPEEIVADAFASILEKVEACLRTLQQGGGSEKSTVSM